MNQVELIWFSPQFKTHEIKKHLIAISSVFGGREWTRTIDLTDVNRAL
jgi:hypothetical protein